MKEVKSSLNTNELATYVANQFSNFFPDNQKIGSNFNKLVNNALERSLFCFSKIKQKNFSNPQQVFFNHLNGDQYATFLYFLSNEGFNRKEEDVYIKSAYLNKALHGIDLFGHVVMPNVFLLVHPVGSIIGRADLSDNLVIYQGVTIGGKHNDDGSIDYPSVGKNVTLFSNVSLIGDVRIADNCVIGANCSVMNNHFLDAGKIILGSFGANYTKPFEKPKSFFRD